MVARCLEVGLVSILLSNLSFAQISTPINQKKDCLVCDWKFAPEIAIQAEGTDACEELFPAACIDSKGEYKSKPQFDKVEKRLKDLVKEAQSKAARQIGFLDMNDALLKTLDKEGFALKKDLSEKAKKYFFEGSYEDYVGADEVFEALSRCNIEKEKITALDVDSIKDIVKLREVYNQIVAYDKNEDTLMLKGYSKNLPGFLNKINAKCTEFERDNTVKEKDFYKTKVKPVCSQKRNLREQAIKLYLQQDKPEVAKKIEQFVASHLDFLKASAYAIGSIKEEKPTDLSDEILKDFEKLKSVVAAKKMSMMYVSACTAASASFESKPKEIVKELKDLVAKSRVGAEFLIDQIYTADRLKKVDTLFKLIKVESMKVAKRITTDPEKLTLIKKTYDRMQLTWLKKSMLQNFKKDEKTGLEIIDEDRGNPLSPTSEVFTGNLNFFTDLNAFYLPDLKFGTISTDLSVTMMPIFIEILDENEFAYVAVLAHEVGHNLGPEISKINGFDLETEYEPLVACLSSSDSAQMNYNQQDESIADTISAEVLAQLISELPAEKRRGAALASVQDFCIFSALSDKDLSLDMNEVHPESTLRVSAIMGGNKNFRKALGCERSSKTFRTCSLKGSER